MSMDILILNLEKNLLNYTQKIQSMVYLFIIPTEMLEM